MGNTQDTLVLLPLSSCVLGNRCGMVVACNKVKLF